MSPGSFHSSSSVVASASVGDPEATRTVYITVVVLAVLGVVLALLAIWMFRRTRPELELLAPLEQMDTRRWRARDPATQKRLLDEARPDGAVPLVPAMSEPDVDDEFASDRPVTSFDDLVDETSPVENEADGTPRTVAGRDESASASCSLHPPLAAPTGLPTAMSLDRATQGVAATGEVTIRDAAPEPEPEQESGTNDGIDNIPLVGWSESFEEPEVPEPHDEPGAVSIDDQDDLALPAHVVADPTLFDTGSVPVVPGEGLLRRSGRRAE